MNYFIYGIELILLSVIFHELGHFFYLAMKGLKPKIVFYFNSLKDFGIYTKYVQTIEVNSLMYFSGIIIGLIPIIYGLYSNLTYIWLLALYFVGIKTDLKEILKLWNKNIK